MGVYVHIPFCEQKCHYCDFHSVVVSDQDRLSVTGSYLVSLHKEARYWSSVWGGEALFALFVGGGTPTVLPAEELADLIAFLRTELPFVDDPEITIEANPHSLTYMGARLLRQAGVNRVSLGVQAFQDHLLRGIGRIHSAEQARESVQTLKKAGLTNINLDLMFGLPGQTSHEWADTLRQTVALGPSHISCYSLILEEGTPMEKWVREGLVHVPGDDQQAEMYALACKMLTKAGYEHYEISNFSEPGFSCQHNLLYWHNKPFIGLGTGATGYVQQCRYTNTTDIQEYLRTWGEGPPAFRWSEQVSRDQEMDETMMVGMRLLGGVDEAAFRARYQVSFRDLYSDAIEELMKRGLVQFSAGSLQVTQRGLFLENQVSLAFLR